MNENQYEEVIAMLTAIYKKIDTLERKVNNGGWRSAPDQRYLDDLKKEASKITLR